MKELRLLAEAGRVSLHQFKYENPKSKARNGTIPSNARYADFRHYTYDELETLNPNGPLNYNQLSGGINSKFSEIQEILGPNTRRDAQHLDSAQMTKCEIFLTSDKKDILSKSPQLFSVTGLRIFHMPSEWSEFLSYLENDG